MSRLPLLLAATAITSLALAGCATASTPAPEDSRPSIVASTSVYGDLAAHVAGDHATVTSFISDAAVDPHSFEASARDQLAIADADLVIENGGGYDPFMDSLIAASGASPAVITAVTVSGLLSPAELAGADDSDGHIEGFNEHVWYSFPAMTAVVQEIAKQLGSIDPSNAASYDANAQTLVTSITTLQAGAEKLAAQFTGEGAAITEPVPLYLLQAAGLVNRTPDDFSEAIEEGTDVPPLALQKTLDLFSSTSVRVLAYNSQTASPETERVREAAEAAGIPVVLFTETLPQGADYVSWMTDNLTALAAALQR